jgi:hypothetical protein
MTCFSGCPVATCHTAQTGKKTFASKTVKHSIYQYHCIDKATTEQGEPDIIAEHTHHHNETCSFEYQKGKKACLELLAECTSSICNTNNHAKPLKHSIYQYHCINKATTEQGEPYIITEHTYYHNETCCFEYQ